VVHEQEAGLDEPNGDTLHLLGDQDHLGPKDPLLNVVWGELGVIVGVDEVAAGLGHDVYAGYEDAIGDLRPGRYGQRVFDEVASLR
jgi:hypothetical protein